MNTCRNLAHKSGETMTKTKPLNRNNVETILPLTPLQEGILFQYLINESSDEYLEQLDLRLVGSIHPTWFADAWKSVVSAHPALRTLFRWEKLDNPVQVVLKQHEPKITYLDFSSYSKQSREADWQAFIAEDRANLFALTDVPFRIALCKLDEQKYGMLITHHHILYDGWSSGIILEHFFDIYHHESLQTPLKERDKPALHDYIKWMNNQDNGEQSQYWQQYLQGYEAKSMADNIRSIQHTEGVSRVFGRHSFFICSELVERAERFVKDNEVTMASLLYAAWGLLQFQYCNDDDVTFGTTVALRPASIPGIEQLVGLLINTVPLRVNAAADDKVITFIKNLSRSLQERKEYESTPLPDIVRYGKLKDVNELIETLVVIENYPLSRSSKGEGVQGQLTIESYDNVEKTNFDVTVIIKTFERSFAVTLLYNATRFGQQDIEKMERHFMSALNGLIHHEPQMHLRSLQLLSEEEQSELLFRFNETHRPQSEPLTIHRLFEQKAALYPDRIALMCGQRFLTYREVNEASNALSKVLLNDDIFTTGASVGIMIYPSFDMVIAILAVLKAGGAYVPLDPDQPIERNEFILQDSETELLLTESGLADRVPAKVKPLWLDSSQVTNNPADGMNLSVNVEGDHLAYILYTSGSTGKPKGVMVEHRSVVNLLADLERKFPMSENDAYLLKTTYTFDVSVTELFGWFAGCGKLVILDKGKEKDPKSLLQAIVDYQITHINLVPSMFRYVLEFMYSEQIEIEKLSRLKYIFAAGEALKPDLVHKFISLHTSTQLVNLYGPTECTVYATGYILGSDFSGKTVPIGSPLSNLRHYIVDKHNRLQPIGIPGELCLSGIGLARGYLHRDDLNREKFIENPFIERWSNLASDHDLASFRKMYKTGDLARWLPDGTIEYLGRNDHQVKARGFRIELGEIEDRLLDFELIEECVVVARENKEGNTILCAYYTSKAELSNTDLSAYLKSMLPAYMIPAYFIKMERLPLTPSGKIDRKALPEPIKQVEKAVNSVPQNELQRQIIEIWQEVLHVRTIGIHDPFFDIGGNSLDLIRVNAKLSERCGIELPLTTLFQFPTVHALSTFIAGDSKKVEDISAEQLQSDLQAAETDVHQEAGQCEAQKVQSEGEQDRHGEGIAVIGMSSRLPGSSNPFDFWSNLVNGTESISFFTEEELIAAGADPNVIKLPNYVGAQGVMQDIEYFDADFFGYSPREAEIMDPQVRVFHEVVWQALEDGGYNPHKYPRPIGLFGCASPNLFWEALVAASGKTKILGELASEQLFNKDYMNTRVAYKLNLTGPAVSVYTACSSSLVAIHYACESLHRRECEMALAGSVTISPLPNKVGYLHQEGMVKSPDGHCRAFDRNGQGFIGGMGAGAVLLKRLEDAVRDGDHIYAVIKASTVNNDGKHKIGYTAPSVSGLKQAITTALEKGKVAPETIRYVETHGAATPLGDSVEIEALTQAYRTTMKNYCGVGSVKTNIGHLDCTSGIAGFMKTALALQHKVLPPTLNLAVPNPKINFIDSPFYPVADKEDLRAECEERGIPLRAAINSLGLGGTNAHVIVEEAPAMPRACEDMTERLLLISAKSRISLLAQHEQLLKHIEMHPELRLDDTAYTLQVGREQFNYRKAYVCSSLDELKEKLAVATDQDPDPVAEGKAVNFKLAAAPIAYLLPWLELYDQIPVFTETFNECLSHLPEEASAWLTDMLQQRDWNKSAADIDAELSDAARHCVQLCFQYVVSKMLIALNVQPQVVQGDSIGELAAIALADMVPFKEMLKLAVLRFKNWGAGGAFSRAAIELELKRLIEHIRISEAAFTIYGGSGRKITAEMLTEVQFWTCPYDSPQEASLRIPNLPAKTNHLADDTENDALFVISIGITEHGETNSIRKRLLQQLGELWCCGIAVDWERAQLDPSAKRVSLPTYPFERQRYWIEGNPFTSVRPADRSTPAAKDADIANWFYVPLWTQTAARTKTASGGKKPVCLLFTDKSDIHLEFEERLQAVSDSVISVMPGQCYVKLNDGSYCINVQAEQDFLSMWSDLESGNRLPEQIVFLWGLEEGTEEFAWMSIEQKAIENELARLFFAVIHTAKALLANSKQENVSIHVITNDLHHVTGEECVNPVKSTVLGPLKVIAQEIPFISCQNIDINLPKADRSPLARKWLLDSLLDELADKNGERTVAYRNRARYVQTVASIALPERHEEEPTVFRKQGVYLITGGLGNIGFSIAEFLAHNYQAKLILLGRSGASPERAARIEELKQQGAEIVTFRADVSDFKQIQQVVDEAERLFGSIHGIIHAAGTMRETLYRTIHQVTREDCLSQFQPKIYGLMHLHRLFANKELDFFHVTSSTSSILGGLGFAAYSAANIFMDSFVKQHNLITAHRPWSITNWEGWKFENEDKQFDIAVSLDELLMNPDEGVEAFVRIVHHSENEQIIVSSGDLNERINRWIKLDHIQQHRLDESAGEAAEKKSRPKLSTEYVAPTNAWEEKIVQVFKQFFGYNEVGTEDNFFELGATSLDMIQISGNLRASLHRNVPIITLFTYPTIQSLAAHLASAEDDKVEAEPTREDRGNELAKGRSSLQARYMLRKK